MDTPILSPIRPAPKFSSDNLALITRKKITSTPSSRKLPPRPPSKSIPAFSRFFSQSFSDKPHAISFNECGGESSTSLSRIYDDDRSELYFEQCFELQQKIGSGSFGDVYKVRSNEDGRYYAVKIAREAFRGKSDRARKLQEVAKHQQLPKHPNLVEFYQAWEEKQILYIQTELCSTSLLDKLHLKHSFSGSEVWNYMADLLMAIDHLHSHNLLHLDIKAENIFLSKWDICKLGDFGLVIDLTKSDLTDATEGDPKYLAKELMQGNFTKSADIFSVGITILEMACDLELPSGGKAWHVLRDGNIPFDSFTPIGGDLRRLIEAMMHTDYDRRPSAAELLAQEPIKSIARRRKLKIRFTQAVTAVQNTFIYAFHMIYLMLVVKGFGRVRQFFGGNSPSLNESNDSLNSTDYQLPVHFQSQLDQSFSESDEVFDQSFGIRNSTPQHIMNGFNESLSKKLPSNAKPRRRLSLRSTTPCSPHFPSTSTPTVYAVADHHVLVRDSPTVLQDSLNNSSRLNLSAKLCDFSDEDSDTSIPEPIIGPKNLLSVFESLDEEG